MVILENIDIDIDIDKAILQNIDIDKISNRFKFGISNRARWRRGRGGGQLCLFIVHFCLTNSITQQVSDNLKTSNKQLTSLKDTKQ